MTNDLYLSYHVNMTMISISQLKAQPSKILNLAVDYPVIVGNRNQPKAYLVGKNLYEKLIAYIEDYIDGKEVKSANFRQGKPFEKVASQLGI